MSLIAPFLKPLQIAINRFLAMDPESDRQLARFENKVIEIQLQPPGISVYMILGAGGLDLLDELDGEPDTRMIGSPLQLGLMGLRDTGTRALFSGDVTIEGDIQLGQEFQRFLKQIDVDLEEPVAQVFGDVIAHQLGETTRNLAAWSRESLASFEANLSEYLREETHTLPGSFEVDHFNRDVDTLRLDTDRLEARVKRLQSKLQADTDAPSS